MRRAAGKRPSTTLPGYWQTVKLSRDPGRPFIIQASFSLPPPHYIYTAVIPRKKKKTLLYGRQNAHIPSPSLNNILWPVDSVGSAIELDKMIPRPVVQTVLFIGPGADPVRNGLDVVPDLLVAYILDVRDLRVLDAELVAVVGTDDGHAVAIDGDHILDGGIALGLVQAVPAALVESACTVELDIRRAAAAAGESGDEPKVSA